ncbi:glycoprotein-N-acetylgalactosamine 3-beta-galactosyltransferase 1 isoform X2 [Penaeus vannamei]|uniref:glycoprotein-N-acetylgalactosamine 3-beta-galactosyltransferase 1 isoform X2 n=1 Tax=Penaeus vannamei TaxID=6689 RepID=UPI00387F5771
MAHSAASIRVALLVLIASVLSAVFTFVFVVPYSPVSRRMAEPQTHEELENSADIPDNPLSLHDPHEIHHEGEAEEANRLAQKVRVLCWVMTQPASHDKKAVHVKATWGRRCNKLIFISSKNNESLGAIDVGVEEGRNMLWGKTKAAYKYAYDHHLQEYDWFLKADDDTYIIVENLRYMLSSYDPNYPIYFGSRFKPFTKQGYMSGGGGYVLSREATRKFVEEALTDEKKCKSSPHGAEDAEIGTRLLFRHRHILPLCQHCQDVRTGIYVVPREAVRDPAQGPFPGASPPRHRQHTPSDPGAGRPPRAQRVGQQA